MFIGFTSLRSSAALKLCITYCHFSCNTLSNELCSNNNKKKQRNSAQYTKYNAFQHKQNFSSFFLIPFGVYRMKAKRTTIRSFFLHSPWKWTTIHCYHSCCFFLRSLSLIFVWLFMFSFSVRTNVSCRFAPFAVLFRLLISNEKISFCFQFQVPSNKISMIDHRWCGNWMAKALCHRVSIHLFSVSFPLCLFTPK